MTIGDYAIVESAVERRRATGERVSMAGYVREHALVAARKETTP
jgi:hypothetical protein